MVQEIIENRPADIIPEGSEVKNSISSQLESEM